MAKFQVGKFDTGILTDESGTGIRASSVKGGKTMDKVVILARVSTNRQDYDRQINELTDYCNRMQWDVAKVFADKVSGAKSVEERTEIQEMVTYIKSKCQEGGSA